MDAQRPDAMTQRLDRLERENRRFKRAGAALLVGLAAVFVMGQALPAKVAKVVEAQVFSVRDMSGTVRATLGASPDGTPYLTLFDKNVKMRAVLQLKEDQSPFFSLLAPDGKAIAQMRLEQDGSGTVQLFDGKQEGSIVVIATPKSPGVGFANREGKVRVSLGVTDGFSLLDLSGSDGKSGISLSVHPDGRANMLISGQDGKPIWSAMGKSKKSP